MNDDKARAAVAAWNKAINDKVASGKSREKAIAELVYTDTHQAYLEAWNYLNDHRNC